MWYALLTFGYQGTLIIFLRFKDECMFLVESSDDIVLDILSAKVFLPLHWIFHGLDFDGN